MGHDEYNSQNIIFLGPSYAIYFKSPALIRFINPRLTDPSPPDILTNGMGMNEK